ncbi:hypothetical protein T4A_12528 [Trichinella pseudospiralis]|uniref:Uncharacterized protein n=1 Tax=Trichinella pseudospiralis TaxID=6337 RepID=A0A0V1EGL5_TRIPS|nr:hypothetical protein T4A_12528 [Trichinella pseudospiralis]
MSASSPPIPFNDGRHRALDDSNLSRNHATECPAHPIF